MLFFNCSNCGECCGPVPVSRAELNQIHKKLKQMPKEEVERLKKQEREPLTCMFRDLENDRCGIYSARPEICKMFGFYEGMVCPTNPQHATRSFEDGQKQLSLVKKPVGVLSLQINWQNIYNF